MIKSYVVKILVILLLNAINVVGFTQDYTQWNLPEGAKIRLGKGRINDVKFAPNGSKLAVATDIGIWIYDAQTGKEITRLKVQSHGGHRSNTITFSPDSITLAVGNRILGGSVELWDTNTGERITVLKQNVGSIKALVFAPDGRILTCASLLGKVEYHMWEVASGREMLHFIAPQESLLNVLTLSPDTQTVVSAERDKVILWDTFTGELKHTLKFSTSRTLAFSVDSKTIVGGETILRSWDTESGNELPEFKGHTRVVERITFSLDGKTFASGDTGGNIILWDFDFSNQEIDDIDDGDRKLTSPKHLRSLTDSEDIKKEKENKHIDRTLTRHILPIKGLDFTADSKMLASGSDDGTLKVWNVDTGKELLTIHGHTGSVKALKMSEDGKMLYSCSSDGVIRMWNFEKNTEQLVHTKQPWYAFASAFSNDGKIVATGCWGEVRLWDLEKQSFYDLMEKDGNFVVALEFSPDDTIVASGHWNGKVRLWDVKKRQLYKELDGHTEDVNNVAFSPDGKKFASGSKDGTAYLWDLETMQETHLLLVPERDVKTLAFSPDSSILITVLRDGTMQIWDTDTHQHIADFANTRGAASAMKFSPDGRTVVCGHAGGLIRIWDVDTRSLRQEFRTGNAGSQTNFEFSPDGKVLVSGSFNGSILIWDLEKIFE